MTICFHFFERVVCYCFYLFMHTSTIQYYCINLSRQWCCFLSPHLFMFLYFSIIVVHKSVVCLHQLQCLFQMRTLHLSANHCGNTMLVVGGTLHKHCSLHNKMMLLFRYFWMQNVSVKFYTHYIQTYIGFEDSIAGFIIIIIIIIIFITMFILLSS